MSRPPPSKPVKLALHAVALAGALALPASLTWLLTQLWYSLFLVHPAISVVVWAVYGSSWVFSAWIIIRLLPAFTIKPAGSAMIKPGFKIAALVFLIGGVAIYLVPSVPGWIPVDLHPSLSFTGDPATSMTLTWTSVSPYRGNVSYGLSPASMNLSIVEDTARATHVINFTGLAPDTSYYYSIEGFDETWSFKTASNVANVTRFAVLSDVHHQLPPHVADGIAAIDPDFVLVTGDLVEFGGMNNEWHEYFNLVAPFATNYSVMTAAGNHDSIFGLGNYRRYLTMPQGDPGELYYHFRYNEVHFIVLHLEWGVETYTPKQRAWLEGTLESIPVDDWIIVASHCMHFSSGSYANATGDPFKLWNTAGNMIDTFHDLFVASGVNMVFSGHDHHFEVGFYDGVVYTIVGTGNSKPDPRSPVNNTQSIYYETGYTGFAEVSINGSDATITGHMFDNGTPVGPFTCSFTK